MKTHWTAVSAAVADGKTQAIVDAYIAAWEAGAMPPLTEDTLIRHLLYYGWRYRLASCVARHDAAREAIAPYFDVLFRRFLQEDYVPQILANVAHPDSFGPRWLRIRRAASAKARGEYVAAAADVFCHRSGREAARRNALRWWADCELEEERESILLGLSRGDALTKDVISQLGAEARALTDALIARERISESAIGGTSPSQSLSFQAPPPVANRLNDLLTLVTVRLDARDARFPAVRRRSTRHRLFQNAIRRLGHHSREAEYLAEAFAAAMPEVQTLVERDDATVFPLMRLLHLRMILEQPELSGALRAPDRFFSPEVMLYILGRDAVNYVPEIRVASGADRRWRAIWAESTAEAMSALVLEDRIALKLVTLARIPEERVPTPDFRALTTSGERIVFECKGATDLETHNKQKRYARVDQLGKNATNETTWRDASHAYACCFFAAREGTSATSRFSVEDPPFAFDRFFGERDDDDAIRRHFAAVLGAAGLRAAAGAALTGNPAQEMEPQLFYAGGIAREEESSSAEAAAGAVAFAGTYRNLEHAAKELDHPNPQLFAGVRMFTGIHRPSFDALRSGKLPVWLWMTNDDENEGAEFQRLPAVGTTANGVYSVLSDGAILAFEVGR